MTNIIRLKTVASTNDYLVAIEKEEKLPEMTFVIADEQQKGRGFAENSWESEAGKNITTSGLFYPTFISASTLYVFNMCISLGVADAVQRFVHDKAVIKIKWPNDIYAGDKKIAGILIESFFTDNRLDYTVAGIGLNVNQDIFLSKAPNPISIKQLRGETTDLKVCFDILVQSINERYAQLKAGSIESIIESYHQHLYKRAEVARFKTTDVVFKGTIKHVETNGSLVIEDEQQQLHHYNFKEVEFVL